MIVESQKDYVIMSNLQAWLLEQEPIAGSLEAEALEYIDQRIRWYEIEVLR